MLERVVWTVYVGLMGHPTKVWARVLTAQVGFGSEKKCFLHRLLSYWSTGHLFGVIPLDDETEISSIQKFPFTKIDR